MATPVNSTTLPINSLIAQPSNPAATSNSSDVGLNTFLQLLTAELQNQDPTAPQDPTASVTQLAQFQALSAQTNLASSFQSFTSNFGVMQASALLGKTVTANTGATSTAGSASTVTGTVASITVQNGQPFFTLNGSNGQPLTDNNGNPLLFSTQQIVGIGS